jgi:hypothetical protein
MGLASSVPASTPANTGIYQYAKPDNPYTDKNYVDSNFVTSGNFDSYLNTDYRPWKSSVNNQIQNQEANFNTKFDTRFDTRFINSLTGAAYVNDYNQQFIGRLASPGYATDYDNKFNLRFDTRFINSLTGAAYVNDYNQQFRGRFDTTLPAYGYNKLDNWKVAQETFTKPASSVLNTQSQSLTRLCYINKPAGSTVEQKELCVDQSGGLYLQGLGLETDKDVYTFIAEQNNTYWNGRNLIPPPVTYTPQVVPATSAQGSFTTSLPTISSIFGSGTQSISNKTEFGVTTTTTTWSASTYTATWTGTVNFSNYQPFSSVFTAPPTTIQIFGVNIPDSLKTATTRITTTITSKTSTNFTYRIVIESISGNSVAVTGSTVTTPNNTIGALPLLSYTATA